MISETAIYRTAERVNAYIQRYVTLAGAERKDEVLELFDKMSQFFPHWGIMTCPVMHPDIHYISRNSQYIFGDSDDYLQMNHHIQKFFSNVHVADQHDLHNCFEYVHDQLESTAPENHNQYRNVFHYRFRKENGQYIYLHDEKAALHLNGGGNLYYALFRDVTAEKNFNGVKVEIYHHKGTMVKIGEFKPSAERSSLTKREGELVALIKQGLSTKEIAWYLKISHNTVRNIKSKLFDKFNVNNTVELLNMTA